MDVIKRINQRIKDNNKPFNDFLLKDHRRIEINKIAEVIGVVYKQAAELFNGYFEFVGYRMLSPEERIDYEANSKYGAVTVNRYEWNLFEYKFRFLDEVERDEFNIFLYIPYSINDFVIIDNKNYQIFNLITDRIFAKNSSSVVIKLLRSPLHFYTKTFTLRDIVSKRFIHTQVPCGRIHNEAKINVQIPVFIYFICKYGFDSALNIFGIDNEVLSLISYDKTKDKLNDTDEYYYFQFGKSNINKLLKVQKEAFDDNIVVKNIAASIVTIFSKFRVTSISVEELISKKEYWYIFLGKLIYTSKLDKAKIYNNVEKHFESLDTYLDPISRERFRSAGLVVNDIYGIFKFIIEHINEINIKYARNEMLLKRFDVVEQLLIDAFIRPLFNNIYRYKNRTSKERFKRENIVRIFSLPKTLFESIHRFQHVSSSISTYNDCKLFNFLSKVIKPTTKSGSDETIAKISRLKFNMSYLLVYSLIGFSTNSPHKSGTVNPFVKIDEFGSFILTPEFQKYLSKKYTKYFK